MLIVEFDGPPSWSFDASETGESTKCPWVVSGSLGFLGLWVSGSLGLSEPETERPTLSYRSISEVMVSDVTGAFYTGHKPFLVLVKTIPNTLNRGKGTQTAIQ